MEAKDYLRRAKKNEIMIRQKREELESLKKDASGKDGRHKREVSAKYKALEQQLEVDILKLHESRVEIIDTIHKLDDSICLIVLHAKWIDGDSLEQIAVATGYSFAHIRRKYWEGMKKIGKMICGE